MGNKLKTFTLVGAMAFWLNNLDAQNLSDSVESPLKDETKMELVANLSQEQSFDSLYNISKKLEILLREKDEWHLDKFYWQDQYVELLENLEKEYIQEVKRLKINETVFKCWEKEFDERMDYIKQEILSNLDKYGWFDTKWNYVIHKKEYEILLREVFPEFYSLFENNNDVFMEMWNENFGKYDWFEKYYWWKTYYIDACWRPCDTIHGAGWAPVGMFIIWCFFGWVFSAILSCITDMADERRRYNRK